MNTPRKIRKNNKKWCENRPQEMDKNRLRDPICLQVGELAVQLAQICAIADPRRQEITAGLPKTGKMFHDTKNTEKSAWKVPKRNPALKKSAQASREATNSQFFYHYRAAAPRKHKTGVKQAREETTNDNESDNTTCDFPDACAFPNRKKQRLPRRKHGNTWDARCTRICPLSLPLSL